MDRTAPAPPKTPDGDGSRTGSSGSHSSPEWRSLPGSPRRVLYEPGSRLADRGGGFPQAPSDYRGGWSGARPRASALQAPRPVQHGGAAQPLDAGQAHTRSTRAG